MAEGGSKVMAIDIELMDLSLINMKRSLKIKYFIA